MEGDKIVTNFPLWKKKIFQKHFFLNLSRIVPFSLKRIENQKLGRSDFFYGSFTELDLIHMFYLRLRAFLALTFGLNWC